MASATFDTLAYVKRLKAAGVPDAQAEAQAEALAAAITNELATKHDLQHAIDALKFDLLKWIIGIALAQIGLLIGILLKVLA